jgi:hypothetical protein
MVYKRTLSWPIERRVGEMNDHWDGIFVRLVSVIVVSALVPVVVVVVVVVGMGAEALRLR